MTVLVSSKSYVSQLAEFMNGLVIEQMAVVNADGSIGLLYVPERCVSIGAGSQLDCGSVVRSNAVLSAETKFKYNEIRNRERADVALNRP